MDELPWKLFETYIKSHPNYLVKHHHEPYNAFWLEQLPEYLREKNPIQILKEPNDTNTDYLLKAKLYIGGKERWCKYTTENLLSMMMIMFIYVSK